jgi:hypothetical protein
LIHLHKKMKMETFIQYLRIQSRVVISTVDLWKRVKTVKLNQKVIKLLQVT